MKEKGPVEASIRVVSRIPGFGEKSASRLVYWLLGPGREVLPELIGSLRELSEKIKTCSLCGDFSVSETCPICQDQNRNPSALMVVADGKDLHAIEKTGGFRGRYFILGGLLTPRLGIGPEQLRVNELVRRLSSEPVSEIIIALSSGQEGEATALWLCQQLAGLNKKVTRLARGLPVAANIEYLDAESLKLAIEGRKEF